MEQRNEYGVYVIFSENEHDIHSMREAIIECTNTENPETDILMLRKCLDRETQDTRRWHLCMRKELLQNLRGNGKEWGLTAYAYRANQHHIGDGNTYAFFIPCETDAKRDFVKSLFAQLEGKFLRPGSYHIHEPHPRENGDQRRYILVSFEKNGDYYPRPFIRTLRALLNDMPLSEDDKLNVKWCNNRVLLDVVQGVTK